LNISRAALNDYGSIEPVLRGLRAQRHNYMPDKEHCYDAEIQRQTLEFLARHL